MTRSLLPFTGDIDRFFGDNFFAPLRGEFFPAIDIYQNQDNVIAELSLPGIDPKDVEIVVENDVLTITGTKEAKEEVKREDYYHRESRIGQFSRSVVLPMSVKGEETKAKYEKGILTITMPKEENAKPKRIAIDVE